MKTYNEVMDIINKEVVPKITELFDEKVDKIYLFGSYAKGNYKEYSDIDIYLLVKDDVNLKHIKKKEDLLFDFTCDLELKYNIFISTFINNVDCFERQKNINPLYINVIKEGVMIYGL